jgi:hypothetical protein
MSNINTALNRSATAAISFNDAQVRFIGNQDTGSVSINSIRNKYTFAGTITPLFLEGKGNYEVGYYSYIGGSITGQLVPCYSFYSSSDPAANPPTKLEFQQSSGILPASITFRVKVGSRAAVNVGQRLTFGTALYYLQNLTTMAMNSENVDISNTYQLAQV